MLSILATCKVTRTEALPVYYNRAQLEIQMRSKSLGPCRARVSIQNQRLNDFGAFTHLRHLFLFIILDGDQTRFRGRRSASIDVKALASVVAEIPNVVDLKTLRVCISLSGASLAEVWQVTTALGRIRCNAPVVCSLGHSLKPGNRDYDAVESYQRMVAMIGG